jgi:general secretion pathway protein D
VVFPVNTNNVTTLLQLKDGETQILGGLLQHQFDQSQTKIPGAGDLPLLGRLFGTTKDTWNKKELLFAITPHVVRNVSVREADLVELWSGTEGRVRYGAPNLKVTGGGGVVGQTGGATATPSPSSAGVPVARPTAAAMPAPLMAVVSGPSQAAVGDKISVVLGLQGGSALTGTNGVLRYDPAVLKALSASEGDLLKRSGSRGKFEAQIDESGSVIIDLAGEEGASAPGGGSVATISFEVVGSGTASIAATGFTAATPGGGNVSATAAAPHQVAVP